MLEGAKEEHVRERDGNLRAAVSNYFMKPLNSTLPSHSLALTYAPFSFMLKK